MPPTKLAKELRTSSTDAERLLWNHLRAKQLLGVKFRRQQPIGKYIVDFVCFTSMLVIEVDGGQHAGSESDKVRDEWLKNEGYDVIRFWNNDILGNIEGVVETIEGIIKIHPPFLPPLEGGTTVK
jgi:very-short-patch-repair endonuclease